MNIGLVKIFPLDKKKKNFVKQMKIHNWKFLFFFHLLICFHWFIWFLDDLEFWEKGMN